MRITMLGKRASGKTTYMSALYEALNMNDCQGFTMRPSANDVFDAAQMRARFSEIAFENRELQFPDGTVQTATWNFDLLYRTKPVCSFEWIDYRGGLLDSITNPRSKGSPADHEEFNKVLAQVASSQAVLVFIDSLVLTNFDKSGPKRLHTGIHPIISLLEDLATFCSWAPLNVMVILTKADSDQLATHYKQNNFEVLFREAEQLLGQLIHLCHRSDLPRWQGAITAVGAVGEGNVKTTLKKQADDLMPLDVSNRIISWPEPFNVAESLFFCVHQSLVQVESRAQRDLEADGKALEKAVADSTALKRLLAKLTGAEDPAQIVEQYRLRKHEEFKTIVQVREHISVIAAACAKRVKRL